MNFDLLIVDDDSDYQFFHKLLSVKSEFHLNPKCFSSGKEVIDYLEEQKDSDENILIFLDLYMTETDGWAVVDFIESLNQPHRIKVIIITSSVNIADKKKALRYSCIIEYIEKPLMKNYLISIKDAHLFSGGS
jgi:response regulator of citrate/malate metabolism